MEMVAAKSYRKQLKLMQAKKALKDHQINPETFYPMHNSSSQGFIFEVQAHKSPQLSTRTQSNFFFANQEVSDKQELAKSKRLLIDVQRRSYITKLNRHQDIYRQKKLDMVSEYLHIMKAQKRSQYFINNITILVSIKHILIMIEKKKEKLRNSFYMLAIANKFRIRFYNRIKRLQGGDVCFRETNRARYKLMYLALFTRVQVEERAKRLLHLFFADISSLGMAQHKLLSFRHQAAKIPDFTRIFLDRY